MDILVPSCPPHLKITQTMIEDFLIDPVLGAKVIFGEELDAFQRVRLKFCWWTPRVMDSSGFSSAKSRNMWIVSNLRALLLPNGHVCGVYYPNFGQGKKIYAKFFTEVAAHSAIYRAQLGRNRIVGLDTKSTEDTGKSVNKEASCWEWAYRNGAQVLMPAPGFLQDAKSSSGYRFNDLYIDEFTKIESLGSEGIDQQLIGRTTRESWNKHHPLWCNHHLFTATAEDTQHPAYTRYSQYMNRIKNGGDPDYIAFAFCCKDYSTLKCRHGDQFKERYREDRAIKDLKMRNPGAGFRQEGLGLWSKNGKGLYTADLLDRAKRFGREYHELGVPS